MPTFAPCAIVALLAFTVIRIKRAEKIGDEFSQCYGDFPAIPQELSVAGEIVTGGRGIGLAGHRTCLDRTHDKDGF